jgi:DNA-binding SARP family transcriptional activator
VHGSKHGPGLRVRLFGKLRVEYGGNTVAGLEGGRVQELFAYLLLHRDRPLARESLATLLWSDSSTEQARKYLRQTLWQLQTALDATVPEAGTRILHVETDWVAIDVDANLWLDIAEFEQSINGSRGIPGAELDATAREALEHVSYLYRGNLLDGWYMDWCLFERERLQNLYLSLLDKLLAACEAQHQYEAGFALGARLLSCEPAHERTHRRLMRLHYMSGDRTAALRQFHGCTAILNRELGVQPSRRTLELYHQIESDSLEETSLDHTPPAMTPALPGLLDRLLDLQLKLSEVLQQVRLELDLRE